MINIFISLDNMYIKKFNLRLFILNKAAHTSHEGEDTMMGYCAKVIILLRNKKNVFSISPLHLCY